MLAYNELSPGTYIVLDGEPYEVLAAQTSKKGRGQASNQTKLRNLMSGKVVDRTFHQSDKLKEADIEKRAIQFLYFHPKKGEYWFSEAGNPKARFELPEAIAGPAVRFVKENSELDALVFRSGDQETIIGVTPPIKVDLAVAEAPPGIRGNTAQGGTKQVTLETGETVAAPLFVEEGDIIRINTETGEYTERMEKKN